MKKLALALFALLPLTAAAQWSLVPSVAIGSSKMGGSTYDSHQPIYQGYMNTSMESKVAKDFAVTAQYTFLSMLYVSAGLGYQHYQSEYTFRLDYPDQHNNIYNATTYTNEHIYLPLTLGLRVNTWKVYPALDAGVNVIFPTSADYDKKSIAFGFTASAGAGYSINSKLGVEAKLKYVTTGDTGEIAESFPNSNTKWQFIGGQLSVVIKL